MLGRSARLLAVGLCACMGEVICTRSKKKGRIGGSARSPKLCGRERPLALPAGGRRCLSHRLCAVFTLPTPTQFPLKPFGLPGSAPLHPPSTPRHRHDAQEPPVPPVAGRLHQRTGLVSFAAVTPGLPTMWCATAAPPFRSTRPWTLLAASPAPLDPRGSGRHPGRPPPRAAARPRRRLNGGRMTATTRPYSNSFLQPLHTCRAHHASRKEDPRTHGERRFLP